MFCVFVNFLGWQEEAVTPGPSLTGTVDGQTEAQPFPPHPREIMLL